MFAGLPHNQHVEWAVRNCRHQSAAAENAEPSKSSRRYPAPVVASTDAASLERARAREAVPLKTICQASITHSDAIARQIKKTNISAVEFL